MKEAIGTSFVFNLVMIFVGVFIALYVGSIAYTKGYKVKNRIIDIIEKHDGYTDLAREEIDANLAEIGYQIVDKDCKIIENFDKLETDDYHYCVYESNYENSDEKNSKGKYYKVTVFIHFDIPLIGQFLEFPISGETRLIFNKNEVEG